MYYQCFSNVIFLQKNQIDFMNRNAENNIVRYNEKYNSSKESDDHTQEPCIIENESNNLTENIDVPDSSSSDTDEINVSELVTKMDNLGKLEGRQEMGKAEDLEQWLDDILDD